ncbi:hypothetical protein G7046_g2083 [Stylonectria norvegica]|nr:hypothetical protein G7046_g2083 [Stylonectria norvegica]
MAVDLILPVEVYDIVLQQLAAARTPPSYSKVTMTLVDILDGDFFTEYIKKGTLTMYLDKETYERAGLTGKPYGAKGGRGAKPRWIVSYDLRAPSMLHGKKGFDRLVYACKNVFNQPRSWLFSNVGDPKPNPDPLQKQYPTKFTSLPGISQDMTVRKAPLDISSEVLATGDRLELEQEATECYEWLALIRLGSPRVEPRDDVDPYIARYQISNDMEGEVTVRKLSWQGFISANWLRDLLVDVLVACPSGSWFFLSATSFSTGVLCNGDELAFLRPPAAGGKYLMWETKSHD